MSLNSSSRVAQQLDSRQSPLGESARQAILIDSPMEAYLINKLSDYIYMVLSLNPVNTCAKCKRFNCACYSTNESGAFSVAIPTSHKPRLVKTN